MLLMNGLPVLLPQPTALPASCDRKKSHKASIPQTIALSAALPRTPILKTWLLLWHARRLALQFQAAPRIN